MKVSRLNIKGLSSEANRLLEDRMQETLNEWEDTPHMDGQQSKGKGVDCVRFVAAILDELGGTKTPIKHLPRDAAFHKRELAISGMKLFIKQFNGRKLSIDEPLQPGDVLVTGPVSGGPGHAIILGPNGFLWHSAHEKVVKTGFDALENTAYKYKATMRVKDRERWFECYMVR